MMKKFALFFIVLFVLCSGLSANAQVKVHLGAVGGLNLASISFDPEPSDTDLSNRSGWGMGGVLEIEVNENVALYGQGMFLQKGVEQAGSVQGINFAGTIKLLYLEAPMMLKFSLGSADAPRPYFMAGPTLGLLLSAKRAVKITGLGYNINEENDIKEQLKKLDLGVGFGGGLSLPLGNNSAFIEGRYVLGLSNLNDNSSNDGTSTAKNKGIQIMAGVSVTLL